MRLDLCELVESIVDDARFEAQPAGCEVELHCTGPAMADVRAEAIHRACEKVIRNAMKLTVLGSRVEV